MSIFDDSTSAPNPNVTDIHQAGENPLAAGAETEFNFSTPPPVGGESVTDGLGGSLDQG